MKFHSWYIKNFSVFIFPLSLSLSLSPPPYFRSLSPFQKRTNSQYFSIIAPLSLSFSLSLSFPPASFWETPSWQKHQDRALFFLSFYICLFLFSKWLFFYLLPSLPLPTPLPPPRLCLSSVRILDFIEQSSGA